MVGRRNGAFRRGPFGAVTLGALGGLSLSLAVLAVPAQAQTVPSGEITVTGGATCNADTGHETWTLHWTVTNNLGEGSSFIIQTADETGTVTAPVPSLVDNIIYPAGSATASDGPVPNQVGTVTLNITGIVYREGPHLDASGTIGLDGSCIVPVTVPSTAPPATAAAVEATPPFTG